MKDRWSGAAPYWEKYREIIRGMFVPVTQALAAEAQIGRGHAVLDIATGPGEPALDVAALVGPEGSVVGTDLAPEMVAAARRAAARASAAHARFEVALADDLPFPSDTFDAVISRFGIMFFPSPPDAVREMLRVLKPEKKLALAVWGHAENNPFFQIFTRALEPYVDSPPPAPDAPEPFRFAASGKLADVLGAAGAAVPRERLLSFHITAPVTPEELWTLRCEMSERLRDATAALSAKQLESARKVAMEALRPYATGSGVSLPAEVVIVSGTRNSQA